MAKLYTQKEFNWTYGDIEILGITLCTEIKSCFQINFENQFNKVKTVTQLWGNRYLSLYGKVLVINTLIGSLFPYILSVMPAIENEMIDLFELYITCFLWNSKKPKISLQKLKTSKVHGGLKVI